MGQQQFELVESSRLTFSAGVAGLAAAAASGTDFLTLTGAANKVCRVLRAGFTATATSAAAAPIVAIRRTTANTGGTAQALTAVPRDNFRSPPASASAQSYTANPTLGSTTGGGGTIMSKKAGITAATGAPVEIVFEFASPGNKPVTLRGPTDVFALNLNSGSYTGISVDAWVEWTEEAQDSTSF